MTSRAHDDGPAGRGVDPPGASVFEVSTATASRSRAHGAMDDADDEWRFTIGAAIDGGRPVDDVAEAAGVSPERAQQIHDDGA